MAPLDWYPKMFSPGDIDGEGARKLLGRPSLHPLATLVRETAQNSWDATLLDSELRYELNVRVLKQSERDVLSRAVFANPGRGTNLAGALARTELAVLEIHDRGTSGLGGPLRNDITLPEGTSTDFIDFIFNIGAPRDTELGGGTYGFGKTISYLVSGVDTIIVWSHPDGAGPDEARLIASAIGDNFDLGDRRYTGRQWWGRIPADGAPVLPVLGAEADAIGGELFHRDFAQGETGTSIMILDICDPDETEIVAEVLAESVMWNLWPKLLEHNGTRAMTAHVLLEGTSVRRLDPALDRRLAPFVASMAAIRDVQAGDPAGGGLTTVRLIERLSPRVHLGHLGLTWQLSSVEQTDDPLSHLDDTAGIRPFEGPPRHIALMRQAELVVRYLDGPATQLDGVGYAGVFRCLPEVDDAFAAAEPPAHDDWEPAGMENRKQRSFVTVALRRIREAAADFVHGAKGDRRAAADDTPQRVAARVASELGDLVDYGVERVAPLSRAKALPKGRKGRSGAPVLHTGAPRFEADAENNLALVPIRVDFTVPVTVVCRAAIGYEGGQESDPDGPRCRGYTTRLVNGEAPEPGIVRWIDGPTLDLSPGDATEWTAVVELPPGLTVDLDFEIAQEATE